jgi:hypothetical protein
MVGWVDRPAYIVSPGAYGLPIKSTAYSRLHIRAVVAHELYGLPPASRVSNKIGRLNFKAEVGRLESTIVNGQTEMKADLVRLESAVANVKTEIKAGPGAISIRLSQC